MSRRQIPMDTIVSEVSRLCIKAACELPQDTLTAIEKAYTTETSPRGKEFLRQYLENAKIASERQMPICQDTGIAVFFVEMGTELDICGGTLEEAISQGTAQGYREGYLRKSIVKDPLFFRVNTGDNTPPIIHLTLVPGTSLKITLAPKGAGSENMSALKMFPPAAGRQGVVDFVVNAVVNAGGNPCPPTVVGVGIGGNFEKVAYLAKKALLRPIGTRHPIQEYADLEEELLTKINASNTGPQGLGGLTTALAVHIETAPCHIASMPVAVNLNCHVSRHASIEI